MATIYQLPPDIIAKIAAGEVIERPAYAVKELIENAIDAGASEIKIYIENAGLTKIQVVDNGEGMEKKDLLQSYQPHTTSKITKHDTLIGIKSMGFRGEALASLAAVSRLSIKSRIKGHPTGYEIQIQDGKLLKENPIGMSQGTIVTSENLFATIPARKKFLKSTQTELRHSLDMVNHFAVAYPSIHFVLQHNKRVLLDFPTAKNSTERISDILGHENFTLFLPVKRTDSHIQLTGFIAKPQFFSSTPSKQILFINQRKVTDKLIALAVKESFGTMLEPTSYPQFVLFLTMPFEMVDVNVHPRKEQVSLINQKNIFQFVKETISEVLQENNLTFQNLSWKRKGVGMTNSFAGKLLRKNVLEKNSLEIDKQTSFTQLHRLYIVVETKNGMILFDQHGAHERILFEKLKQEFMKQQKKGTKMKLPKPITMKLTKTQSLLLKEHQSLFTSFGFQWKAQQLIAVPTLFQDRNPKELLVQLLEDLEEDKVMKNVDGISEEMLAFLACRAAVKAGDILEESQMKKIAEELEITPNNATCPHGRPTKVFFEKEYIDSLFRR